MEYAFSCGCVDCFYKFFLKLIYFLSFYRFCRYSFDYLLG